MLSAKWQPFCLGLNVLSGNVNCTACLCVRWAFSPLDATVTENKRSSIWQIVITGGTVSCHNDNLRCHQWRQSCQIDDLLFSTCWIWIICGSPEKKENIIKFSHINKHHICTVFSIMHIDSERIWLSLCAKEKLALCPIDQAWHQNHNKSLKKKKKIKDRDPGIYVSTEPTVLWLMPVISNLEGTGLMIKLREAKKCLKSS